MRFIKSETENRWVMLIWRLSWRLGWWARLKRRTKTWGYWTRETWQLIQQWRSATNLTRRDEIDESYLAERHQLRQTTCKRASMIESEKGNRTVWDGWLILVPIVKTTNSHRLRTKGQHRNNGRGRQTGGGRQLGRETRGNPAGKFRGNAAEKWKAYVLVQETSSSRLSRKFYYKNDSKMYS